MVTATRDTVLSTEAGRPTPRPSSQSVSTSAKGVSGEGGAQEARQGDGNLNGGEEAGGLLHHLQELGGGAVALLRHHAELAGVEGDDGDLRHGEEGVDQDQNDL